MGGLVLDIIVEWVFRIAMRSLRSLSAIGWPIHEAKVTGTFVREADYGCDKAEIKYTFVVEGTPYAGTNVKPFVNSRSARSYAAQFERGRKIVARVKLDNPTLSILRDRENHTQNITW